MNPYELDGKTRKLLRNSQNGGFWAGLIKAAELCRVNFYPEAAGLIELHAQEFWAKEQKRRGK